MAHRKLCTDILKSGCRVDESGADVLQYWVVYAFLTVLESMINASYWFPFYYTFKFVFIMYMALPQTQ